MGTKQSGKGLLAFCVLSGIWFSCEPQPYSTFFYWWIIIYVISNLVWVEFTKNVVSVVCWLVMMPSIISVVLWQQVEVSNGFNQGVILIILYGVIWAYGAFAFDEAQYKTALSFIGAALSTILTLIALASYYQITWGHEQAVSEYLYKYITLGFSPMILGGLWGKFCIDYKCLRKLENIRVMTIVEWILFGDHFVGEMMSLLMCAILALILQLVQLVLLVKLVISYIKKFRRLP